MAKRRAAPITPEEIREIRGRQRDRNGKPLTQEVFAAQLGVARATLARWELGLLVPRESAARLLRIIDQRPQNLEAQKVRLLATQSAKRVKK
jgi:DNA-binding transcriptional regulator YiaG